MNVANTDPIVSSHAKPTGAAALVLMVGGLLASIATASCCALPILLGAVGLGSTWFFRIALVAGPHQTALLIAGGLTLVSSAVLLSRQPKAVCATDSWSAKRSVRIVTSIGLAIGAFLYWASLKYS
jgi:mercuric ion transport protein